MKPLLFALVLTLSHWLPSAATAAPSYAPDTLSGDTVAIIVGDGSGVYASSGGYLFQPTGSGNGYRIVPLTQDVVSSVGTFTYTRTGANSGQIVARDTTLNVAFTVTLNMAASSTGTFQLTGDAGTQSGQFQISYPRTTTELAPRTLLRTAVIGLISSGSGNFASSGAAYLQFLDDKNFDEVDVNEYYSYYGTYGYNRTSATQGGVALNGGDLPVGAAYRFTFTGSNRGTFTASASDGSQQQGQFYFVIPPVLDLLTVDTAYSLAGWYHSAWFGDAYLSQFNLRDGFIYHSEHGWLFATGSGPQALYLWDSHLGWLYTSANAYPNFYSFSRGAWLYYEVGGTPAQRWFYDYRAGQGWFAVTGG